MLYIRASELTGTKYTFNKNKNEKKDKKRKKKKNKKKVKRKEKKHTEEKKEKKNMRRRKKNYSLTRNGIQFRIKYYIKQENTILYNCSFYNGTQPSNCNTYNSDHYILLTYMCKH